jgi:hypothetical protein
MQHYVEQYSPAIDGLADWLRMHCVRQGREDILECAKHLPEHFDPEFECARARRLLRWVMWQCERDTDPAFVDVLASASDEPLAYATRLVAYWAHATADAAALVALDRAHEIDWPLVLSLAPETNLDAACEELMALAALEARYRDDVAMKLKSLEEKRGFRGGMPALLALMFGRRD